MNYNDGFIAYLNGTEIIRRSLPGSVNVNTPATPHAHGVFETVDLTSLKTLLLPGRNVLAVELHLAGSSDTDAYFDADLAYTRATNAPADTDNDGIPDAWEIANGLNPTNNLDAQLDTDGDGFTALQEYVSDTNPNSANSRLSFAPPTIIPGGFRLSIPTVTGRTYRIEYSDNLATWFTLEDNIYGTGGAIVRDDLTSQQQRFYRLRVSL